MKAHGIIWRRDLNVKLHFIVQIQRTGSSSVQQQPVVGFLDYEESLSEGFVFLFSCIRCFQVVSGAINSRSMAFKLNL